MGLSQRQFDLPEKLLGKVSHAGFASLSTVKPLEYTVGWIEVQTRHPVRRLGSSGLLGRLCSDSKAVHRRRLGTAAGKLFVSLRC